MKQNQKTKEVSLTYREIEVVQTYCSGYTIAESADDLDIAVGTFKKHLDNIYKKLNVSSKFELMEKARELNLIQ